MGLACVNGLQPVPLLTTKDEYLDALAGVFCSSLFLIAWMGLAPC